MSTRDGEKWRASGYFSMEAGPSVRRVASPVLKFASLGALGRYKLHRAACPEDLDCRGQSNSPARRTRAAVGQFSHESCDVPVPIR